MFSFLSHPWNRRFARAYTTFFSNFGGGVVGIGSNSKYGPAICRGNDTVIATIIVFSIRFLVFNKILLSYLSNYGRYSKLGALI